MRMFVVCARGLAAVLLGISGQGSAAVQGTPGKAMPVPVVWRVGAPLGALPAPGTEFRVAVTAEVAPGWHLYALDEPEGGPVALEFSVPADGPAALVSVGADRPVRARVAGTEEPVMFYVGAAHFQMRLRVRASTGAGRSLSGAVSVRYQACNDRMCLPPRVVTLPFAPASNVR